MAELLSLFELERKTEVPFDLDEEEIMLEIDFIGSQYPELEQHIYIEDDRRPYAESKNFRLKPIFNDFRFTLNQKNLKSAR